MKSQLTQLQQQTIGRRDHDRAAPLHRRHRRRGAAAPAHANATTEPATVIASYGEINYNRPTHAGQDAQADLRRFVLGLQHRLDPKTKVVAEIEVEHAVSSAPMPARSRSSRPMSSASSIRPGPCAAVSS